MLLDQTGDFVHEKHFSVSVAFKVFFATRIKMFMSSIHIHMHIHMQYICTCMFVTLQSPHTLTQGLVISANFRKRFLGQIWNLDCNVDHCYSVIYFFVQKFSIMATNLSILCFLFRSQLGTVLYDGLALRIIYGTNSAISHINTNDVKIIWWNASV